MSPVAETSVAPSGESAKGGEVAAIKSGTFVKAEQPTQGTARIVNENAQRYAIPDNVNLADFRSVHIENN